MRDCTFRTGLVAIPPHAEFLFSRPFFYRVIILFGIGLNGYSICERKRNFEEPDSPSEASFSEQSDSLLLG